MNKDGFTLVEIMITLLIMAVVIALTVPAYVATVDGISSVSSSEESKIDNLLAMELIRLDLQHVGTGIGLNETTMPISYTENILPGIPSLDLRSTLVNSSQTSLGWGLINCTVAGGGINPGDWLVDQREDTANINLVLLDTAKNYVGNTTVDGYTCPGVGIFTVFPHSNGFNACGGPPVTFCSTVQYRLSAAQPLDICAPGTRNLIREVGNPGAGGDTLVNCVAGMRVRFDLDDDASGSIGVGETEKTDVELGALNASQIQGQVKVVDMYLLVQVGREEVGLNSNPTLTVDGVDFTNDLAAVANSGNYRWKIFKVSAKPNSWL